jgi:hypothetical protein
MAKLSLLALLGLVLIGCGGGGAAQGGSNLSPYRGLYSGEVFSQGAWHQLTANLDVRGDGQIQGGAWSDGGIVGQFGSGTADVQLQTGQGDENLSLAVVDFQRALGDDCQLVDGQTERIRLHLEVLYP